MCYPSPPNMTAPENDTPSLVTERRPADVALKESRDRYRLFAMVSSEGIFFHDNGIVIEANDAFVKIIERPRETIIGMNILKDLIRPEDAGMVARLLTTTDDQPYEITAVTAAGRHFPAEVRSGPGEWAGRPCRVVSIRDITHRKKTEDQLIQSQKMAAIGTLSSGIAHDFKNMLAGIQGNVEILRHQLASHSPHQKRLDIISQIVQRGAKLSGQLLGYARGGQTDISPIDLNHLVTESLEMFGQANRNISIETHLSPDTPVINGNRNQIEQVLLNLLINAVQAMPTGGRLLIETKASDILDRTSREYNAIPGRYAKLSVQDTGHGMDRETQRQIFEPFFTTKPEGQGTGLGLASTYGIIKNHKGYIDVSSQPGRGSCFSLLLPAEGAATLPEAVAPTHQGRNTSDTILLIDDEADFLDVGREMLLLLGYQVITATDVDEALARLTEANGQMYTVILDMVMPGPGVETTLSRIVRIAPTVPLLLSSGFNREGESIRQLLTRCHGFIPKPYRLAELSKAIRDARDIMQAQSENRS